MFAERQRARSTRLPSGMFESGRRIRGLMKSGKLFAA
jgi:hypothetical protein